LFERFGKITENYNEKLNSEWICRAYMSAKLIMTATLQINAAAYAEDKNVRVVIPYLRYYAVLSLLRAICYTVPEVKWEGGTVLHISHAGAIRAALEHLRMFNRDLAATMEVSVRSLKAERELLSYRAPSAAQLSEKRNYLSLCTFLAEVAQFNSELFEQSISEHGDASIGGLLPDYLRLMSSVDIEGHLFIDDEDAKRLDYIGRKHTRPTNLLHMMTEGHVEDFFGYWTSDDPTKGMFDPDENWQVIFDIP
jgi:hypothetical protein